MGFDPGISTAFLGLDGVIICSELVVASIYSYSTKAYCFAKIDHIGVLEHCIGSVVEEDSYNSI